MPPPSGRPPPGRRRGRAGSWRSPRPARPRPVTATRSPWSCERHFQAVELLDLVHLLEVLDHLVEVAGRDAALVAGAAEPGQVHDAGRAAWLVAVLAADGADEGEGFGGYLADGLGGDCRVTHASQPKPASLTWLPCG